MALRCESFGQYTQNLTHFQCNHKNAIVIIANDDDESITLHFFSFLVWPVCFAFVFAMPFSPLERETKIVHALWKWVFEVIFISLYAIEFVRSIFHMCVKLVFAFPFFSSFLFNSLSHVLCDSGFFMFSFAYETHAHQYNNVVHRWGLRERDGITTIDVEKSL